MFYVSLAALIAVTATPSAGQTTIPFTYVDNRMVVECKIDGQGPFTMPRRPLQTVPGAATSKCTSPSVVDFVVA